MASKLDTTKVQRAFERAAQDEAAKRIGAAALRKPFTDGLKNIVQGADFPPNSLRWLARKQQKGWGDKPWIRTGKTLEALSNNPPTEALKTQGGVKFGFNRRKGQAFGIPRSLTGHNDRKRLKAKRQGKVLRTLQQGSRLHRLREGAAKAGQSIGKYVESIPGASATGMLLPPRPLMRWERSWMKEIERDVEQAIRENLKKEGFRVRR